MPVNSGAGTGEAADCAAPGMTDAASDVAINAPSAIFLRQANMVGLLGVNGERSETKGP
ncbi:hypothetical protein D3C72_2593990 [compost metagenome]